MTSAEINAEGRARQDWRDGMSSDHNPYPYRSDQYIAWQREMNRLLADEMQRELRDIA